MLTGSCLSGAVGFEVEEIPSKVFNCHCTQCRKSHGAAFATQAFADGSTLKFVKGEDKVKEYSGHGGVRAFCSECGSRLMNYAPDKNLYLSVAMSSLDNDYQAKPVAHAFVAYKAPWYTTSDDIPAFEELPAGALD